MRALWALLTATRPELQAVSMARQGPDSPKTYEMRPVGAKETFTKEMCLQSRYCCSTPFPVLP